MAHFEVDVKALKMNRKTLEESCPKDSVIPSKHSVKKSSPLYRLNPFCDPHGILRVGGRIKYATVSHDVKFPIILSRSKHVTELIIRHYHEKVVHQGRGVILNKIRSNGTVHGLLEGHLLLSIS